MNFYSYYLPLGLCESRFLRLEYSVELLIEYSTNTGSSLATGCPKQTDSWLLIQSCITTYNNGLTHIKIMTEMLPRSNLLNSHWDESSMIYNHIN